MSVFLLQFRAMVSQARIVTGDGCVLKIQNKSVDALAEDASIDEIAVAGGIADSGGIRATIAQADIPGLELLEPVEYRGREMSLLSWRDMSGVTWEITCGTPEQ